MNTPRLRVAATAFAAMQRALRDALPKEAGGILIGWRDRDDIVITDAIPVPDADADTAHYVRRHQTATCLLDSYLASAANPLAGYVGEWHTHPEPSLPSRTDFNSIAAAADQTDAAVAIVVLAWDPTRGDCDIHSAIVRRVSKQLVLTTASFLPQEGDHHGY